MAGSETSDEERGSSSKEESFVPSNYVRLEKFNAGNENRKVTRGAGEMSGDSQPSVFKTALIPLVIQKNVHIRAVPSYNVEPSRSVSSRRKRWKELRPPFKANRIKRSSCDRLDVRWYQSRSTWNLCTGGIAKRPFGLTQLTS